MSTDHGLPGLHLLEGLFGPHLPGVLEEEGGVERGGHGATHRDAKVRDVANLRAKYIAVLLAVLDLYTVVYPLVRDILLNVCGMFCWLVGPYCSYLLSKQVAPQLTQKTCRTSG